MIKAGDVFASLRRHWVRFLVIWVFTVIVHSTLEFLEESEDKNFRSDKSLATATGVYQRIMTAPRVPSVRFTKIVEIDPVQDIPTISSLNVCRERAFLAHLLKRISDAKPAIIVVDKYFGKNACDDDDEGTRALIKTIEVIRAKHPVVVGLRTKGHEHGSHSNISVIEPTLSFGSEDQTSQEGVINIVQDNRRLPLQWLVYVNQNEPKVSTDGKPVVRDTLALTTAKLYEPHLLDKYPRLRRMIAAGEQPFIGFLEASQFMRLDHFYASEIVCGRRLTKDEDWKKCINNNPPPTDLQNRIVLIGENNPDLDEHHSVVGKLAGFYLQANYIEALLDDRYFRPVGQTWGYIVGLIFLALIEGILYVCSHKPLMAFFQLIGLALLSYFVLREITIHQNVYIDPWPTLIALFLQVSIFLALFLHRSLEPNPPS